MADLNNPKSSEGHDNNDGFTYVKRKNSSRRNNSSGLYFTHPLDGNQSEVYIDPNIAISRVLAAKQEILESDFYASASAIIREGLELLGKPEIHNIVCYGLGNVADSMISRHQLAFLLSLNDKFPSTVFVYDPLFNETDKLILSHFNCTLIQQNEEGKRVITEPTFIYAPHAPQLLLNNFLYANWSVNLKNCLFLCNSFSSILESTPKRLLANEAGFILKIAPYVDELFVMNTFKYLDIFNNTSLHVFQEDKLCVIDPDFWDNPTEPNYLKTESDLIVNTSLDPV